MMRNGHRGSMGVGASMLPSVLPSISKGEMVRKLVWTVD
jgi:hypothetical protein